MNKQSLKTQIENLYQDILINLRTEKIDDYFAAEYIQETDHDTLDLTEFKAHLKKLKEVVKTLTIERFKDMLIDEQQQTIFLRYDVSVEKKDSSKGNIEVYAIFKFNESGKVTSCRELTKAYHQDVRGLANI
ncbi:nuclear transport factor 2 family protein [Staphylococcus sp. GSSP0090]|nr:nuclear transport factor 2 family protein [Staphylococcus sp. GSSP0090]